MVLSNRSRYLTEEAVRTSERVKRSLNSRFRGKARGKLPQFSAGTTDGESVVGATDTPMMPTQRSGELFSELFATYPIAIEIVKHLRRTELMQLGRTGSSMNNLLWTRIAPDSFEEDSSSSSSSGWHRRAASSCSSVIGSPTAVFSPHTYPVVTVAAVYIARLRVYSDELNEVDSDRTNGGTRVGYAYREDMRHPRYGPGTQSPICTCGRAGCCRLGMCLGRGDAEDIWQPIPWSRVDQMDVAPFCATRNEVEKLIATLEVSANWTDNQIGMMKAVLAHRSLAIQNREKAPLEWYWQLLSKHCQRCAVCGKTDDEISDPLSHSTYSVYKGTEKCWGCDVFFCTGCGIKVFATLPGACGSRWVHKPGSHLTEFTNAGQQLSRAEYAAWRAIAWGIFLIGQRGSKKGWSSHFLSCPTCFMRIPREGHRATKPRGETVVDLPVQSHLYKGVQMIRVDLRKIEVLRAVWKQPEEGVIDAVRGPDVQGWGGVTVRQVTVMGENLEWTMVDGIPGFPTFCEWSKPSYYWGNSADGFLI